MSLANRQCSLGSQLLRLRACAPDLRFWAHDKKITDNSKKVARAEDFVKPRYLGTSYDKFSVYELFLELCTRIQASVPGAQSTGDSKALVAAKFFLFSPKRTRREYNFLIYELRGASEVLKMNQLSVAYE